MSSDAQAFKIRRNVTVGDPKTGGTGPWRLPAITCPGTAFATRIDIRTRFDKDNKTLPIRVQWIKGLRVYCSNNEGAMPQGTLNWDAGVVDGEVNGPVVASGVKDVSVGTGDVVHHFGYSNFVMGSAIVAWRQADVKELRECVLAEVGGTGGNWLFSLNLGFLCPDAIEATTVAPTTPSTPIAEPTSVVVNPHTGLGAGAVVGIVLGIGAILAAVAALIFGQRQRKHREVTQENALMCPDQGPPPGLPPTNAAMGLSPPDLFAVSPQHQTAGAGVLHGNQFAARQHPQQGHVDAAWKSAGTGDIVVIGAHQQQQHHVHQAHTHQQVERQSGPDVEELFLAPPPASKGQR